MEIIKMSKYKISEDSANALLNGKNFKRDNTKVLNSVMELYGNKIAWIRLDVLTLSDCGWQTATTKDRLNAILSGLGLGYIFQKDFVWYYSAGNGCVKPFGGSMEVKL
jgi:hypothetical protein